MSNASVRRSRCLVTYWENGFHKVFNYATRTSIIATELALAVLERSEFWTSRSAIRARLCQRDASAIDETIDRLVSCAILESTDRPSAIAEREHAKWGSWNPAAGFFHGATKALPDLPSPEIIASGVPLLSPRQYPQLVKEYETDSKIELPVANADDEFARVLHARRTWREFGPDGIRLAELSTLLRYTFGVQRWLDLGADRWVALKTSPSGGARHSIEAYVLAFNVSDLDSGTYHYDPDVHTLSRLPVDTPQSLLASFLPTQEGFHSASALIVMTAVFERVWFKYKFPRAYRTVSIDAGHLGQTFALVATSIGLAPFCTAAIEDALIEDHLGIDGVSESVVFAVGVGSKPADKDWAPNHDRSPAPATRPPNWAARASG